MHLIEKSLLSTWPAEKWETTRVVIAVSGGADSVALARALHSVASDKTLVDIAHFNHRWRGEESEQDAAFVRDLASSLGCRFFLGQATDDEQLTRSEASAREDRYRFLTTVAYQSGARYVATAHTATDRVETLLHNLCRGTGLPGVSTPTRTRSLDEELVLVRPLLGCSREMVLDFLRGLGQGYREDASNADLTFRRNYIRHAVLPLLRKQYGESVDDKLLSFSELAEEATQVFDQYAIDFLEKSEQLSKVTCHANAPRRCVMLPCRSVLPTPWPVLRQALTMVWKEHHWPQQAMSRSHWLMLRDVLERQQATRFSPFQLPGNLIVSDVLDWISIHPAGD